MINNNRIVPVQAVDLISLYGLILLQNSSNSGLTALEAVNPGEFKVTDATNILLAAEPVATLDIDATESSISAATIYFVPAYNFAGFTVDGAAATMGDGSVEVNPDGRTLYKAVLATGAITVTKVGF